MTWIGLALIALGMFFVALGQFTTVVQRATPAPAAEPVLECRPGEPVPLTPRDVYPRAVQRPEA